MIEIIKNGKDMLRKHTYTCPFCGCVFTYEDEDIHNDVLNCPWCKNPIVPVYMSNDYRLFQPGDSFPTCEECSWGKKMRSMRETYVGDSPCNWCIRRQVTV